jgi:hypothetical protein
MPMRKASASPNDRAAAESAEPTNFAIATMQNGPFTAAYPARQISLALRLSF